jgi:2-hydroxy-6-oxonona-2,4-dienedioate hydrolase
MGNSLGGHIATLLAVELPERVRGLILTGSSGLFERGFSNVPGTRPKWEWIYTKCCEVFYDACHVTDALVKSVMDAIYDRRKARILIQLAKSAKRDNIAGKLKEISCPTLIIWGKQDKVTQSEVAEEFNRKIRHSKLVWLNNCGHAPMIEHPMKFGREVARWWAMNWKNKSGSGGI